MSKRKFALINSQLASFSSKLATHLQKEIEEAKDKFLQELEQKKKDEELPTGLSSKKAKDASGDSDYESCVLILQRQKAFQHVFHFSKSEEFFF